MTPLILQGLLVKIDLSAFNIVTLAFSGISIFVSIIVFFKNRELTKKYNNLVAGQQALQIHEDISSARKRYEDLSIQSHPNNQAILQAAINSSMEDLCNTYDLICSLYLSDSLEKETFKKQYFNEIKDLVEHPALKEKYVKPYTKYPATSTVYEKWFHPEK